MNKLFDRPSRWTPWKQMWPSCTQLDHVTVHRAFSKMDNMTLVICASSNFILYSSSCGSFDSRWSRFSCGENFRKRKKNRDHHSLFEEALLCCISRSWYVVIAKIRYQFVYWLSENLAMTLIGISKLLYFFCLDLACLIFCLFASVVVFFSGGGWDWIFYFFFIHWEQRGTPQVFHLGQHFLINWIMGIFLQQ